MQKFFDNVTDKNGHVLAGASVTVTDAATGALSTIYSNNSLGLKANPITCDSNGYFEFYAANGRYNIDVTGAGLQTRHVTDVLLEDIIGQGSDVIGFLQSGTGAVSRSSQDKMREVELTPQEFAADATGVASNVLAFQQLMAAANLRTTARKIRIPAGTYLFTITGDADTILIPSNVEIRCDPGVVFKWGYWGSPLFAIVNKSNVRWYGGGTQFVWSGTFGTTSGSRDAFSYGRAIPAYEWCAHVACVGSNNLELSDLRCAGDTTANNLNNFFLFRGNSAGGLTSGNKLLRITAEDVCQGSIWSEQDDFDLDIDGGRYASASAGLYGPGHVLYVTIGTTPSQNGRIKVRDRATSRSGSYQGGGHSVSLKNLQNVRAEIDSIRPEGALNFLDATDVKIDLRYRSSDTTADGNGAIFAPAPVVGNAAVKIKAVIAFEAARNVSPINLSGIPASSSNIDFELDADITMTCDGTESSPAIAWVADRGIANVRYKNKGSGAARVILTPDKGSSGNNFTINARGTVPNPRVVIGGTASPSNNLFFCSGDSTVDFDSNEFTPSSGNAVIWQSGRQYDSQQNLGVTTNPGGTFQLPMPGAYMVQLSLKSSDANHARDGLYWVVFDDANTNDYTTAQLIGAQISKGGAAPSVLSLTVSNTGLCTVTSTAGSNTWLMKYGYRQLSQD